MPELPEVETTKASLTPLLGQVVNKVAVYQPKLRWQVPDDLSGLVGYQLTSVSRRAKYLLLTFTQLNQQGNAKSDHNHDPKHDPKGNTKCVIIHLGMSGSLQQYPLDTAKRKHDHVIWEFQSIASTMSDSETSFVQLHYHDPRRFGAILWAADNQQRLLGNLGVEPLTEQFTAAYLYQHIHRLPPNKPPEAFKQTLLQQTAVQQKTKQAVTLTDSISNASSISNVSNGSSNTAHASQKTTKAKPITKAIKSVIMEQQVVVGVGNIYATESLFLSGIHPATPANLVDIEQLTQLVTHIKNTLSTAIKQGGSTLKDFTVAGGTTGYFQQTLLAYGHAGQPCPYCQENGKQTLLSTMKINGRASVFCEVCQPAINT